MVILPGDLLFVRSKTFIGESIDFITHSTYNHVAIFTSGNTIVEANTGIKVKYQDADIYKGVADVFRIMLDVSKIKKIITNVESCIGYDYDYGLLLIEFIRYTTGIILPWHEQKSRICSTLISNSMADVGEDPTPQIKYPTPGDLANANLIYYIGHYI